MALTSNDPDIVGRNCRLDNDSNGKMSVEDNRDCSVSEGDGCNLLTLSGHYYHYLDN